MTGPRPLQGITVIVHPDLEQGGRVVIADEQDIVYRGTGSTLRPRAAGVEGDDEPAPAEA